MADFTCPECNCQNIVDPPNGESWWDSNTEEFDCQQCKAKLYVHVSVDILLTAELNTDGPVDDEDTQLSEPCEGCKAPAVTRDSMDVPLCGPCFDALPEVTRG